MPLVEPGVVGGSSAFQEVAASPQLSSHCRTCLSFSNIMYHLIKVLEGLISLQDDRIGLLDRQE